MNSIEHTMKLYAENFKDLVQGKKVREYRLNDAKRKLIKQGDTIRFQKLPNYDEEVLTEVTKREEFSDWYSCYEKYFNEDFKDTYEDVESTNSGIIFSIILYYKCPTSFKTQDYVL